VRDEQYEMKESPLSYHLFSILMMLHCIEVSLIEIFFESWFDC